MPRPAAAGQRLLVGSTARSRSISVSASRSRTNQCAGYRAELHVGRDSDDVRLRQRQVEPRQRFLARGAVHDQLGDHRVVEGRDHPALAHPVVDAHAAALEGGRLRLAIDVQGAGGGKEVVVGGLGADARLDRVAVDLQLVLLQRQGFAGRHAQLPFDEVEPGDGFGHRMLHLQPRVHLHEEVHARGALPTMNSTVPAPT
jgi:hypothetical protein